MANVTPPSLTVSTTIADADLMIAWPTGAGGPLYQITWANTKTVLATALAATFLSRSNNLSDLGSVATARANLSLGTAAQQNTGTSGNNVPLLNAANTWSLTQTTAYSAAGSTAKTIGLLVQNTAPNVLGSNDGQSAQVNFLPSSSNTTPASIGAYSQTLSGGDASGLRGKVVLGGVATTVFDFDPFGQLTLPALATVGVGVVTAAASGDIITTAPYTYVPTVSLATPGSSSFTYGTHIGRVTEFGDLVYTEVDLTFTPTIGSGSGTVKILLPVTVANLNGPSGSISLITSQFAYTAAASLAIGVSDATHAFISMTTSGGGTAALTAANLTNGAAHTIRFSILYKK